MAAGKPWTYDELLMAMNLYCKLPFGQLRHGNPLIVAVAEKMGRTPSSLSMKLCNLASLDPNLKARGIKGLSGASAADRAVWEEFGNNWEALGVASEEKLHFLLGAAAEISRLLKRRHPSQSPVIPALCLMARPRKLSAARRGLDKVFFARACWPHTTRAVASLAIRYQSCWSRATFCRGVATPNSA